MKRLALVLAALMLPAMSFAQPIDGNANMNYLLTAFDPGFCDGPFAYIDEGGCADLVSGPGAPGPAFLWVVVSREGGFDGFPSGSIGAAQFGVEYDASVLVQGWFLCTGGLEAPDANWPLSGSGNAVTWANGCYAPVGTAARAGFFIVGDGSAGGPASLIPDARIDAALWADCGDPPAVPPQEFALCFDASTGQGNLMQNFDLGTANSPVCGDNCPVPTEEKSWGQIKALF